VKDGKKKKNTLHACLQLQMQKQNAAIRYLYASGHRKRYFQRTLFPTGTLRASIRVINIIEKNNIICVADLELRYKINMDGCRVLWYKVNNFDHKDMIFFSASLETIFF
jgi:hypothetical protein